MAMSELKTKPTDQSVEQFIAAITDPQQREDSHALVKTLQQITGKPAKMWGSSIVGFDSYHYRYASGQEGDWPVIGFSPRKNSLTIYIMDGFDTYGPLLKELGPHKLGKSCLYLKGLADIDLKALEQLMRQSVGTMRERYSS